MKKMLKKKVVCVYHYIDFANLLTKTDFVKPRESFSTFLHDEAMKR